MPVCQVFSLKHVFINIKDKKEPFGLKNNVGGYTKYSYTHVQYEAATKWDLGKMDAEYKSCRKFKVTEDLIR